MSTVPRTANPVRKHRREVWLWIIAPVALTFLALVVMCVILAIGVATDALVGKQINTVMSLLATVFIVCPMTLLCLIPYGLFALSAYGTGWLYANAQTPLRYTRRVTERIAGATNQHVPRLARPLIAMNVWLTRWEKTLLSGDQPPLSSQEDTADE